MNEIKPRTMKSSGARRSLRSKAETMLLAAGFGGAIAASAAMLWPSPEPELKPLIIAEETPIVTTVEVQHAVEEDEPLPALEVEAERPVVAIAHEDRDTDFEAKAQEQIAAGELAGALESLRKHLYVQDPTAAVLLQVGRLAGQTGQLALAEQALLDASALNPMSTEVAIERGRILLEAGELGDAREAARQAIRLDRDNASAWNLAGRVAMAESHWQRAETAFRAAVQLEPTDPMLHNNLGLLYVMTGEGKDAIDSLEASVELYGDDVPYFVFNNLGLAYERAKRFDDARGAFEQALIANPGYARAQVNLRRVLTTLANVAEAEAYATRTAEAEPEKLEAIEAEAAEVIEDAEAAPGEEQLFE